MTPREEMDGFKICGLCKSCAQPHCRYRGLDVAAAASFPKELAEEKCDFYVDELNARQPREKKMTATKSREPRENLAEIVEAIGLLVTNEMRLKKEGRNFPHTLNPEVALWFLKGAEAVVRGEEASLDKALGIKKGRGRPRAKPSGPRYERAKKTLDLRWDGKSWYEIADALDTGKESINISTLQDEQERYYPYIIEEMASKIRAGIKGDGE